MSNDFQKADPDELTKEEYERMKEEKLQYTLDFVYNNNPFYREMMDEEGYVPEDFKTFEDLKKLPVINSETIKNNQPPKAEKNKLYTPGTDVRRPYQTSGTSGNPKTILKSYDELENIYEEAKRGFELYEISEDDVFVNYFPFVALNPSGDYGEGLIDKLGATSVPISNTPYPPKIEYSMLKQFNPDVIMGLASHVDAKGRIFKEIGANPQELGVNVISLAGEPVTESRKKHISETFGAEVYDFLATTESGGFAYQCKENESLYHVLDNFVHVEIIGEDKERLEEGEEGHLAVTNLLNPGEESAMPLLRYDLKDIVSEYNTDVRDCGCDINSSISISSPKREAWEFIVGAVNLNAKFVEDKIYNHDDIGEVTKGYQVKLDYEEDEGDIMNVLVETNEENLLKEKAEVTEKKSPENKAEEIAQSLLEHQQLRDTVENMKSSKIKVNFVRDIEMPKGKPQRVKDLRD